MITRRELLRSGLGWAGAAALVGVAGPDAAPVAALAAVPNAGAVQRGGEIVQAQSFTFPTFDLHVSSYSLLAGYVLLFDCLVRYDPATPDGQTFAVKPGLAESWEQPDPKTVVFHLRRGVRFHDGSEFNAAVAKWNLERLRDNPQSVGKTYLTDVVAVDAPNAATLRVQLAKPSGSLPFRLSTANFNIMGMQSKAAFDRGGDSALARTPVGTGPMKFKQWITDDRLVLERNPDYWRPGADGKPLPYADSFVSRYIPDLSVAVPDLQSGALTAAENMPVNQLPALRNNPRLKLIEWPWAGPSYFHLGLNMYKPPFNDVRVRRAALYGIDRESMAKALGFGYAKPRYYAYWTQGMAGYDSSIVTYPYDPDKTRALLREAGYQNGIETDLLIIQREPEATIGQFAVEMWSKIGIKTTLRALERLTWINAVHAFDFKAMFSRNTPQQADPVQLSASILSNAPLNWSGFKDDQIDFAMKSADSSTDPKTRATDYRQALTRLQEQAYIGDGYTLPFNHVASARLEGLFPQFGVPDFSQAWLRA